ncbi:MAG: lipoate--protein ligase family protein [Gemmataceae bacterium]
MDRVVQSGACKTPGGKMVQVQVVLEREGTWLKQVQVRGDFFLHPADATNATLAALEATLTDLPADTTSGALAARIQAAIPFGVELLGTSPQAIAIAIRRAITGDEFLETPPAEARVGQYSPEELLRFTDAWAKLPWRILPEVPLSAVRNVALDEVLTDAAAPALRFWRWSEPAVILGRCQSVRNEVDAEAATALGLRIVRRMTGGGAMFLQPHGAITYSLYLPEEFLAGLSIRQSYEVCEAWVIQALRGLGVDAHHVPINDIACSAGKIGGAAQARRRGMVLHHTTMAYDMDPGVMTRVLRIGREKLVDKAVPSAAKRVSPLVQQTGLSREAIVAALLAAFQGRFGGSVDALTPAELQAAEQLAATKYGSDEWTQAFA